jgi:hypothetical protein
VDGRTEIKIIDALGATRITEESDGILVFGNGRDRKIELLTEEEAMARPDLERMGHGEGRDFWNCISIAGRHTSGKVWREATVYTSRPGKRYALRLTFYKLKE